MKALAVFVAVLATPVHAQNTRPTDRAAGREAWARIYEVVSHPRCANCHVGPSDRPMWSGPSYGKTRPHGMNIRAGESRIGAETIPCRTCHITSEKNENTTPHMAPQVADAWRLAPVEADWFGRSSDEICGQLRDPDRNGGRTSQDLASHLDHDVILHWAWTPGGGPTPAPYSLDAHIRDVLAWGAAGQPCAFDPLALRPQHSAPSRGPKFYVVHR